MKIYKGPEGLTQAYYDGLIAGNADRALGRTSNYARLSFPNEPEYTREYSRGYNAGQRQSHRSYSSTFTEVA